MTTKELQQARRAMGLTQAQLADQLGVTQNTVARWEIGLRRIPEPTARLIERLAAEPRPRRTKPKR